MISVDRMSQSFAIFPMKSSASPCIYRVPFHALAIILVSRIGIA